MILANPAYLAGLKRTDEGISSDSARRNVQDRRIKAQGNRVLDNAKPTIVSTFFPSLELCEAVEEFLKGGVTTSSRNISPNYMYDNKHKYSNKEKDGAVVRQSAQSNSPSRGVRR